MATDFEAKVHGRKVRIVNASDGLVAGDFYAIGADFGKVVIASVTLSEGSTGASRLVGAELLQGTVTILPMEAIQISFGVAILYQEPF